MRIERTSDDKFVIRHQGKIVSGLLWTRALDRPVTLEPFDTERDAEHWADTWIDDQVFDSDNTFGPPLQYAATATPEGGE